jgi:ATP-dependent helicase HepA
MLEIYAVVECVAPAALHSDRFLPVTPIRVLVDHAGNDITATAKVDTENLRAGNLHKLLDQEKFRREILPSMLTQSHEIAGVKMKGIVAKAVAESDARLGQEIDRLVELGEINDHVSEDEILALKNQRDALHQVISKARLRFDAVRIIWCQP